MEKLTLKDAVAALIGSRFPDDAETTGDALLSVVLPATGAAFVTFGLMKKCCCGDGTAIKLLKEITGEAEPQPVINISGASSFSNFTDVELEILLQQTRDAGIIMNGTLPHSPPWFVPMQMSVVRCVGSSSPCIP